MCSRILGSTAVEAFLCVLVVLSFALVIVEADSADDPPPWIRGANIALLTVYAIEVTARIFVLRCRYFSKPMNVLDLTIVLADVVSELLGAVAGGSMPSLVALRIFRLLRLARTFKVMVKFPQLALLVKGLANALSAVLYGVALLLVVLLFWSVCAVHFIHPVNQRVSLSGAYDGCARCGHAFETVHQSLLTLTQQIVAGDSWGVVTIPVIEEAPATALFFAMVFVSVQLTIVNVLLAVIVDTALKTSQDDLQEVVRLKAEDFNIAAKKLRHFCHEMDLDHSGDLSEQELVGGFERNEEFRDTLLSMDIKRDDMAVVFSILDADGSGTVNYEEFIQELFKMKSHDSHTLLVFIKHYVTELRRELGEQALLLRGRGVAGDLSEDSRGEADRVPSNVPSKAVDDDTAAPLALPIGTLAEERAKDPGPGPAGEGGSAKQLWEELRSLRAALSEDLLCSMREISRKSEGQARLLASIAADTSLLRGGDIVMPTMQQFIGTAVGEGGLSASTRHEEVLQRAEKICG